MAKKKEEPVVEVTENVTQVDEVKAEAVKKAEKEKREAEINESVEELDEATKRESKNRKKLTVNSAREFEKDTKEEDDFLRRSVELPSKRRQKKLFVEDEIIGDEYGEIDTDAKQRKLEYELLSDSARAEKPKILLGRVIAVEPVELPNGAKTYEAVVSLITNPGDPTQKALIKKGLEKASHYRIHIPAPMFFFYYDASLYEGPEGESRLFRDMRVRKGSLVEFVVYKVNPDEVKVIGSRIRAMQLRSYEYYLSPRTRQIEAGSEKRCRGRISIVSSKGVVVEVLGAECFISNENLSHRRINNATDEYEVGDTIPVVVKTVETDKTTIYGRNYSYVRITASAKEAERRDLDALRDKYHVGSEYSGVVTYRLNDGLYFVRLGNEVDVVCKAPNFGDVHIEQKCAVIITDIDKDFKLSGRFSFLGR